MGQQFDMFKDRRGGAREGAGRPKKADAGMPHGTRPTLSRHVPVHVTLRLADDVPNIRRRSLWAALREAFRKAQKDTFRLCEYVVMGNHCHLIVEADNEKALSRGMQGLETRMARRINKELGRRGKVFRDRFHERQL